MAEKIQKAKEAYYKMVSIIQQQTAWVIVKVILICLLIGNLNQFEFFKISMLIISVKISLF